MWSYPHSACKFHYLPERVWSCQVSSLCLWKISTRSVDGPPLPSPRDPERPPNYADAYRRGLFLGSTLQYDDRFAGITVWWG
jgi:hypothetical protein